jgi:hypothetical protein
MKNSRGFMECTKEFTKHPKLETDAIARGIPNPQSVLAVSCVSTFTNSADPLIESTAETITFFTPLITPSISGAEMGWLQIQSHCYRSIIPKMMRMTSPFIDQQLNSTSPTLN